MTDEQARVRRFLTRYLPPEAVDAADIFATGVVGSLFALQLVLFVEKEFDLTVGSDDLEITNFQSVAAMARFIERKRSAA